MKSKISKIFTAVILFLMVVITTPSYATQPNQNRAANDVSWGWLADVGAWIHYNVNYWMNSKGRF